MAPILLLSWRSVAVAVAPFGIPSTAFWIYVCGSLVLVAGLIRTVLELRREHGFDTLMSVGRLFLAIPMGVFASEHFTITATIASLIPRWIPGNTLWAYAVGTGFMCAAFAIATLVQAQLAATLLGTTFLIFVLTMDLPAALTHPANRFFWALTLRELSFSAGAFALAIGPTFPRPLRVRQPWAALPRLCLAIAALFYGVEGVLHPRFVPVIPLNKLTPEWLPGRTFLTVFVAGMLIVGGVCFLISRRSRNSGMAMGLAILLAIVWVYIPMLVAASTDLVALNFFFDTLLFCGAVLLVTSGRS